MLAVSMIESPSDVCALKWGRVWAECIFLKKRAPLFSAYRSILFVGAIGPVVSRFCFPNGFCCLVLGGFPPPPGSVSGFFLPPWENSHK